MASPELENAKRRAANQQILRDPTSDARRDVNTPDYPSAAYLEQQPRWQVMRDVVAGTDALRQKSTTYLPQFPLEDPEDYKRRVSSCEFHNATERTIKGLTGMVFRRPPQLEDDVPEQLVVHWENIDGAGTHGDEFCREVFDDGMTSGHAAILVDYPSVPEGVQITLADERNMELRPYWVPLKAEQILSLRTTVRNGKTLLTQFVFKACTIEPKGEFGEQDRVTYRVFRLTTSETGEDQVIWQVWEEQRGRNNKIQVIMVSSGVMKNMTRIPVSFFYAGDKLGWAHTKPPLYDLAQMNLSHWNVLSDHRHSLHKASVPLLVFIGRDTTQGTQPIGVNMGIDIPLGGDMKYVEHAGSALGQTREELQAIEGRMGTLGLGMLSPDVRAAETAEAKRIDKSAQDSQLASAARSMQDCIELALSLHAEYLGIDPEAGGSALVNREFEELTFDPSTITALSQLHLAGQIDLDTLWSMLEQGKVLPEDFDREKVRAAVMKEAADAAAQALEIANAQSQNNDQQPPPNEGQ